MSAPNQAELIRDALAELGLTQREFSRLSGRTVRTVNRWCSGRVRVPNICWFALRLAIGRKVVRLQALDIPEVE